MNSLLNRISGAGDTDPESFSVERARQLVLALVEPIEGSERLSVRNALGRVLAEDILATANVPGHDNSAMDGYAVRFSDLSIEVDSALTPVGTAFAGRPFAGRLEAGQCVRIMTGGVIPDGADTVVIQEMVRDSGGRIVIPPKQRRGQHVRRAGEDLRIGMPAIRAGKIIRPADLGLIASLGVAEVNVRRRLRVAFFSTGDELRSVGTPLQEGEVYDSNRYTLYGMLDRLGCEAIDLGVVRDRPAEVEAAFRRAAAEADAILTSGGVSVGEADFVRGMMAKLGEVAFWQIAMRPGRPMAFGRIGSAWLFGLPGNPVAVMVTFHAFVRDALLKMMGVSPVAPLPQFRVPCATPLKKRPGRSEFQRGILFREDGIWKVRATGSQGSGVLRSMSEANCIIVVEHERGHVEAGELVSVQPFEGLV
ncbi:MAG: molybdopterin molybdotransferase MoeA [Rhodocyclaceae bacterium]|jgi:molybdopterin molybdotransferase|uniref:Molybdopterin molybdenumtransferase n=1 Tax=Candidatus Desulfobacillus denitrificans TaxID=2608985 RepID=A0A809RWM0_9PROT|nr:molybdopterin molybdotransferase MoeA [Zoogloeaceae bacterium]MCL4681066.1 molybdopterin molybdotransferase MoeA [Rhodocyclaceae bacterium]MCZ2174287.1 molybdopterin molybdotransferase MoeA [Burkholderiales bacterium]OQY72369.1 MAG: molybdopterin molybdenumtransferase MoeA [Rhodocyclaceae bacterium UTPRO2]BBO20767.1 molybdopterin molybdenumtransferase MoeA [Candidatus Desulfobacillus denitrificans]